MEITLRQWAKSSTNERAELLKAGARIQGGLNRQVFLWTQTFKDCGVQVTDEHMLRVYDALRNAGAASIANYQPAPR